MQTLTEQGKQFPANAEKFNQHRSAQQENEDNFGVANYAGDDALSLSIFLSLSLLLIYTSSISI